MARIWLWKRRPSQASHCTSRSAMKCISMVTVPVPWHFSQRPPSTLKEKWRGRVARGGASVVFAEKPGVLAAVFQVGRGIGAQRARRQFLAHVDHLAHQLEALDAIAGADFANRLPAPAQII